MKKTEIESAVSSYKQMLHEMIDDVNDLNTLTYLYVFDQLYIKDQKENPVQIQ